MARGGAWGTPRGLGAVSPAPPLCLGASHSRIVFARTYGFQRDTSSPSVVFSGWFFFFFLWRIKGTCEKWDDHLTFELNLGHENIRISTKSFNYLRR